MKRIFLVLAIVLTASPLWAGLTITAEQNDCNEVTITYDMDDTDPNLPRAFALEISLSQENGANIGQVTYVHPEFHVYPGSIVIAGGQITDQGAPVAERDANSIIVEMGSLYAAGDPCHTTAPDPQGTLLVFKIANDMETHVNLAENSIRGGVLMEDTTQTFPPGYVTLIECDVVDCECCYCGTCPGDQTGDFNVSIADLSAIVSLLSPAYAGTTPPYTADPVPPGYECADVTGDYRVSIADLSSIVAYLAPAYAGTTPPYTAPCMIIFP
ncbi:MAG: hypothetical protein ACYS9Y_00805 [Planctomycetota bacterium]|jgi:hypothetical protein